MQFHYGPFDGHPFTTPDSLFPSPKVIQFILTYGQQALEAMDQLDSDEEEQYIQQMIDAGLLQRHEQTGRLEITPRLLKGIEHKALLEIFRDLARGNKEGHPTTDPGSGDDRTDGTRPYAFGDPLSEIELGATLRNTLRRAHREAQAGDDPNHLALPLRMDPGDFELYTTQGRSDCATCVLIDLSGSMMRYGRFLHAKRVALGMAALIRSHFPQDTIDFVGFHSTADRIAEKDLPLVMPKPVSIHDYRVRIRLPLAQAQSEPQRVPQHFTNLQLGLRLARQILTRRGALNKQVFIITDGQPTAHVEPNAEEPDGGELLCLLYPPSPRTTDATLQEALRCQQRGIRMATFALIEDYDGMDWVGFVDQLTRLTRGAAFYCSSADLASTVIESYLTGRKRKSFIA
jgi:uncharacterized protein with von Willebrand factor type A (vWA) domain